MLALSSALLLLGRRSLFRPFGCTVPIGTDVTRGSTVKIPSQPTWVLTKVLTIPRNSGTIQWLSPDL